MIKEGKEEVEEAVIDAMLQKLSDEEKEIAARSSYQFLLRRLTSTKEEAASLDREKEQQARCMVRRYLKAKKKPELALNKLKETLSFRQNYGLDALRLCFSKNKLLSCDPEKEASFRKELAETMPQKEIFVQGFDKAGRALWIGVPRSTRLFEPEAYIRDAIYTLERAIACSEVNGQDQVTAILDYDGYHPIQHNPPIHLSQRVLSTLRNHYVGRLHRICLVNAPWSMRTLWKILTPFAGRETRQKIVFVANDPKEKERLMGPILDRRQALSWMLPDAQNEHEPLNVQRFLRQISFDQPYTPHK